MKGFLTLTILFIFSLNIQARFQVEPDSKPVEESPLIKGFRFHFGGTLNIPLKDEDENNPTIPDEFENLQERPSIASFFNPGTGINTEFSISINPFKQSYQELMLGINYNYSRFKNSGNAARALGERLTIDSFSPFIGYGELLSEKSIFTYGYIGPSFKKAEGNFSSFDFATKSTYSNAILLRLGVGFQINVPESPFFLDLGMNFEIGSIYLEKIQSFDNGILVAEERIIEDNKLSANSIGLNISLGYKKSN